jgi:hypothetical protein
MEPGAIDEDEAQRLIASRHEAERLANNHRYAEERAGIDRQLTEISRSHDYSDAAMERAQRLEIEGRILDLDQTTSRGGAISDSGQLERGDFRGWLRAQGVEPNDLSNEQVDRAVSTLGPWYKNERENEGAGRAASGATRGHLRELLAETLGAGALGAMVGGESAPRTGGGPTGRGSLLNCRTCAGQGNAPARSGLPAANLSGAPHPFTFRGTNTPADEVLARGFRRNSAAGVSWFDLYLHAHDANGSAFISTSRSAGVARVFGANVAVVRPRNGIDVNETLREVSPHPVEREVAVPRRIEPEDVRAMTFPTENTRPESPDGYPFSLLNPRWRQ